MARLPFVGSAAAKLKALCSIDETAKVKTVPSRIEHSIFISNYKNYIIIRAWYSYEMHTINLLVFFSETNVKCLMITSEKHQEFFNELCALTGFLNRRLCLLFKNLRKPESTILARIFKKGWFF